MRLFLCGVFLLSSHGISAFEIENFKSGSACTDNQTFGWICHNSKDIYVTGQSKCKWNGESKPCTWYGFEFDYSDNKNGTTIECTYQQSYSGSMGNPSEVTIKDADSGSYSFDLKEASGHFYNPQYIILNTRSKDEALLESHTICKVNNEKVFEFGFNIHFPISK
ncbi:hypothetical protein [Marinicella litoralis]|uniref:Uncharacterized protein n=1 Tax=Marinicella litoralis TaxID=644220 RepID=A0A4V3DI49_9GAMM|nr:hypothetical protein [Marinicella litoralis]TDR20701.1 hypothetical protein C8D91_1679 [Marinicella litoralis]